MSGVRQKSSKEEQMTREEIERDIKFLLAHRENLMRRVTDLEVRVVELDEAVGVGEGRAECHGPADCSFRHPCIVDVDNLQPNTHT